MKIQVIHIGKVAQQGLIPMVGDYRKRLNSFLRAEDVEMKADPSRDKRSSNKRVDPIYQPAAGEFLVLLDERGKQMTSQNLAKSLQGWIDDPRIKTLTFLVGPPYGFDDITRTVAGETWSLSAMTIPSDFAWVLVWEQLYRAMTILKGMPYHHD